MKPFPTAGESDFVFQVTHLTRGQEIVSHVALHAALVAQEVCPEMSAPQVMEFGERLKVMLVELVNAVDSNGVAWLDSQEHLNPEFLFDSDKWHSREGIVSGER